MKTIVGVLTGALFGAAFAVALAAEPSVIGDWRLTAQYYNGGGHNFAAGAPPLRLAFGPAVHDAAAPTGRIAAEGWETAWPAWPLPDGPAPLAGVVVRGGPAKVEADYRVLPAPGDDTVLVVHETCVANAEALTCEVQVRFERGGQPGGGFTWRRVFARETAP